MASNPLEMLGMTMDEVLDADDALRVKPAHRDGRICLCGHGMTRHKFQDGMFLMCNPSRMSCPCKRPRPVFDSEDTRPFMRKTGWSGSEHAFSRGLAKLVESGKSGEWMIDLKCDACKTESSSLIPVCLNQYVREIAHGAEPEGYDALFCPSCVDLLRDPELGRPDLSAVPNE
jgi:hypothetical protein